MIDPYFNRLIAIEAMLQSPHSITCNDGLNLLDELLKENCEDPEFLEKIRTMAKENSQLETRILGMVYQVQHPTKVVLPKHALQTREEVDNMTSSVSKLFISYSHKDEGFKDELITMLSGLQRQGVIDTWQDRLIKPGAEWFNEIHTAMEECNMAVLLVSPDFIASRFIQEKELVHLFQRRVEEGLRVIPIIVRPCLWESEPAIQRLQVLPKNAKPVISFSGDNGDRDQVWMDISKAIENLAKSL
jgi:hypothetical protein